LLLNQLENCHRVPELVGGRHDENYITRPRTRATTPAAIKRIIFTPTEAKSCKQNRTDDQMPDVRCSLKGNLILLTSDIGHLSKGFLRARAAVSYNECEPSLIIDWKWRAVVSPSAGLFASSKTIKHADFDHRNFQPGKSGHAGLYSSETWTI
jgi:hypothetical protein